MNDQIQTYVMNVSAGVRKSCPTCGCFKAVWVGETEGGDTLTCCGTCQRVLTRRRTDSIPPLSVNSAQVAAPPAPASSQPVEPAVPLEMHLRSVLAEWRKRRDNALTLQEANADLDDFRDGIAWKIGALNDCITEVEEVLSLFVAVEPAPVSVPPPSEELDLAQQLTAERKAHDATLKRLAEYAVELEAFRASSPAVPPPPTKTEEETKS